MEAARRHSDRARPKRFYKEAAVAVEEGGLALHLDGKRAITPGRNPLIVPHAVLAEAIAAEWRAQGGEIDPGAMPATRLANSAIDGVAARMEEVRREVLAYAGTDLLYYRAGEPEGLVARQREGWDPILAWAEKRFGARFVLAEGIAHVAQPETTLAAIAEVSRGFRRAFSPCGLASCDDADGVGADRAGLGGRSARCRDGLGGGACRRGLEQQPVGDRCGCRQGARPAPAGLSGCGAGAYADGGWRGKRRCRIKP